MRRLLFAMLAFAALAQVVSAKPELAFSGTFQYAYSIPTKDVKKYFNKSLNSAASILC